VPPTHARPDAEPADEVRADGGAGAPAPGVPVPDATVSEGESEPFEVGAESDATNPGSDPELLRIRRPQDGAPVGTVPVDGVDEVRAAVRRARRAQAGWAALPLADRIRHLAGLRRVVARRAEAIADRIEAETGKPRVEALAEVALVAGLMRRCERRAPALLGERRVGTGLLFWKRARIDREPWGVVAVIAPWNYPFTLAAEPAFTALYGGNTVVLKPSERTPFVGAHLTELLEEASLPPGLIEVVQGRAATGEALVTAGVDRIHLTGSPTTGRRVLAAAAPRLTPVSLELGGKDPAIVLADADLDRAARGIAFGAFFNAGQSCVAVERVYVEEPVYEKFLRRLTREVSELRAGSGGRVDVGPIATPEGILRIEEQIADAVERGARVLCGGARVDPASNIFVPTVLADVTDRMRVMREETFGPLVPVMAVRDADEAVERANSHPMGLSASVWTSNRERGLALARRLRCGGVTVNDALGNWALPQLPVGGVGESGFSSMRGDEGLLAFTRPRVLVQNRGWRRGDPWWFPYRPRTRRIVRALTAWYGEDGVRRLTRPLGALFGRGER